MYSKPYRMKLNMEIVKIQKLTWRQKLIIDEEKITDWWLEFQFEKKNIEKKWLLFCCGCLGMKRCARCQFLCMLKKKSKPLGINYAIYFWDLRFWINHEQNDNSILIRKNLLLHRFNDAAASFLRHWLTLTAVHKEITNI